MRGATRACSAREDRDVEPIQGDKELTDETAADAIGIVDRRDSEHVQPWIEHRGRHGEAIIHIGTDVRIQNDRDGCGRWTHRSRDT
jgi:hypothetical protein